MISLGERLTGRAGDATEITFGPDDGTIDQEATVATWFIDAPGQSPAWRHYVLGVVHLRPIEGQTRPPVVTEAGATHEIIMYACDPELDPTPDDMESWEPLRPLNLVAQFQVPDDEAARSLLRLTAQAVVEGRLWAEPPLSGQTEPWHTIISQTSAHFRGVHDDSTRKDRYGINPNGAGN